MSINSNSTEVKEVKTPQATPGKSADKAAKDKPKKPDPKYDKPKPKAQLHQLTTYSGQVGSYYANPHGLYDSLTLVADGAEQRVKFPPQFGQALQEAAQPGAFVTVLAYPHTTPKGDQHLHLASLEVGGLHLPAPAPGPATEPFAAQGIVTELLRDPKGHPHGLRLAGEPAELRFPPHLGEQLANYLTVGAAVQVGGQRRPDRVGEVRAPGQPAPVQLERLTVGGESFLIR